MTLAVLAGTSPQPAPPRRMPTAATLDLTRLKLIAEAAEMPVPDEFADSVTTLDEQPAVMTTAAEPAAVTATATANEPAAATSNAIVDLRALYDQVNHVCMVSTDSGCAPLVSLVKLVIDTAYACTTAAVPLEQAIVGPFGAGPVDCDALVAFAEEVAADLLVLLQACASGANPTCKYVLDLAIATAATALRCVHDALIQAGVPQGTIETPSGGTIDCAGIVRTVQQTLDAAVALAKACADGTNATCAAVLDLTIAALATLNGCVAGALAEEGVDWSVHVSDEPLTTLDCGGLVRQAHRVVDGAVRLVQECATGVTPACATALALVRAAGFTVMRCVGEVTGGGVTLLVPEFGTTDAADVDCAALVRQAREALDSAVRFAGACADGTDPTCAAARDLAIAAVNTASACVTDAAREAGVNVENRVGTTVADADCDGAVRTARQLVDAVLLVVLACADGSDATCRQVAALLAAAAATVKDCATATGIDAGDTTGAVVDCDALVNTVVGTVAGLAAQAVGTVTKTVNDVLAADGLVTAATTLVYALADDVGAGVDANADLPSDDDLLALARAVLATVVTDTELGVDPHIPVSHEQLVAYVLDTVLYLSDGAGGDSKLTFDVPAMLGRMILVKTAVESARRSVQENTVPPAASDEVERFTPLGFPSGFEVPDVATRLATYFGSRFTGTWVLDEIVQQTLAVGVTGATAADTSWVSSAFGADARYVRVVPAAYSEAQLESYLDTLLAWLDTSGEFAHFHGAGPHAARNKLIFTFRREVPAFRAYAATAVPVGALEVVIRPGLVGEAMDSYESYPPYKAGKRVRDFSFGSCTSGYAYFNASTNQPYGSTAGHCALVNHGIYTDYNNRDWIGDVVSARFHNQTNNVVYSDSAVYKVFVVDYASNKLYVNSDLSRSVLYALPKSGLTHHLPLCMRGMTSGVRCGHIESIGQVRVARSYVPATRSYQSFKVYNLACWSGETRPGDSGGPVYYIPSGSRTNAWAAGVNSMGSKTSDGTFIESCFEPVYNTLAKHTYMRLKTST